MVFDLIKYAWYTHYKIPRKANGRIVLDENQRDSSKDITLLIPAFKETEVIENTLKSIARLNYYEGKYHALLILDEKELKEKERDSGIILPTARDILDGCYTEDSLYRRIKQERTDLKDLESKDYQEWVDYYLHKAEILSIATLSKFNGSGPGDVIIPLAHSLLRSQALKGDITTGDISSQGRIRAVALISKEQELRSEREKYLVEIYGAHPAFDTTIDIVRRLKESYRASGRDIIDYTIVPTNYDGSYRNPQILSKAVPSSKGRALNWGLNEVERRFPRTDIIGVYDSDARPHEDVLAYINQEMQKNSSKYVFYQGPIYLVRNYNNVHWVCKQSGLQGTSWHRILYPIYIFKHQDDVIHFSGTNYFYTMDAIRKTDGYPPFHPTEDLGLAYDVYALRLEGKLPELKIVPHPYEELEQTTQSWRAWFKQQYRWASGGPYQLRRLMKNDRLPKKDKVRMIARLMSPFPLCIYALFLSMTGLSLTALAVLGLAEYPVLSPEVMEAIKYTMLTGFVLFLTTPVGIYLWSIKRGYIESESSRMKVVLDSIIIAVTTIPYFIIATIPVIQAWTNPLTGWGAKTPRTDERHGLVEEMYLKMSKQIVQTSVGEVQTLGIKQRGRASRR